MGRKKKSETLFAGRYSLQDVIASLESPIGDQWFRFTLSEDDKKKVFELLDELPAKQQKKLREKLAGMGYRV